MSPFVLLMSSSGLPLLACGMAVPLPVLVLILLCSLWKASPSPVLGAGRGARAGIAPRVGRGDAQCPLIQLSECPLLGLMVWGITFFVVDSLQWKAAACLSWVGAWRMHVRRVISGDLRHLPTANQLFIVVSAGFLFFGFFLREGQFFIAQIQPKCSWNDPHWSREQRALLPGWCRC